MKPGIWMLALAAAAGGAVAEQVVLPAAADTWIEVPEFGQFKSAAAARPGHGSDPRLVIKGRESLALLQFDLAAAKGMTVTRATLRIHREPDPVPLHTVGLSTVSGSAAWSETGAGFRFAGDSRQAWAYSGSDIVDVTFGQGGSLYSYQRVTDLGDGWYQAVVPPALVHALLADDQYGLLLDDEKGQTQTRHVLSSREGPHPPVLVIEGARGDRTAPGPVRSLRAPANARELGRATLRPGSVILRFGGAGDDAGAGVATRYELRYSDRPLDAAAFDAARPVARWRLDPLAPKPHPLATANSLRDQVTAVVEDLDPGRAYYFAARAIDEAGNAGPVSPLGRYTAYARQFPSLPKEALPSRAAAPLPSPAAAPLPSRAPAPLPSPAAAPLPSPAAAPLPSRAAAPLPSPAAAPLPSPAAAPLPSRAAAPLPSPAAAPLPSPAAAPVPSRAAAPLPSPAAAPVPSRAAAPLPSPAAAPLPSPTAAPLPSPAAAPLPSRAAAPLPSPAAAPLPSPAAAPLPSRAAAPLPSPAAAPLPSPAAAPLPSPAAAPLPSPAAAPLPSRAAAPLPSPAAAPLPSPAAAPLPSRAAAPLPSPAAAPLPSRAAAPLPSPAAAPLPSPAAAPLPSRAAAPLPSRAAAPVPSRARKQAEAAPNPPVWAVPELWKIDPRTGDALEAAEGSDYRLRNAVWNAATATVRLQGARNEFVAFQLAVEGSNFAGVAVTVAQPLFKSSKLPAIFQSGAIQLYREWFVPDDKQTAEPRGWYPDALVPLAASFDIPARDNAVPGQTVQPVFVDVYIPHDAAPGTHSGRLLVAAPGLRREIALQVEVLPLTLPDKLNFVVDLNCYSGVNSGYDMKRGTPEYRALEVAYHRLAHLHRANLDVLGYSHNGSVEPGHAPGLTGEGANTRISDWTAWDAHFAPILDGSAFRDLPRASVPVPAIYLPFFENWPGDLRRSYRFNDYPAARTEEEYKQIVTRHTLEAAPIEESFSRDYQERFSAVAAQFAEHIKQSGWSGTDYMVYFNNKYYYKRPAQGGRGVSWWLMDEPNHRDDVRATSFLADLLKRGTGRYPDVPIRLRTDISRVEWIRDLLAGQIDVNCISPHFFDKNRYLQDDRRRFGKQFWHYSTTNHPRDSNVAMRAWCWRVWLSGGEGIVPWNAVRGAEAWDRAEQLTVFYTGRKFGQNQPFASLRLKAFRRGQQDIEYLVLLSQRAGWDRDAVTTAVSGALDLSGTFRQAGEDDAGTTDFRNVKDAQLDSLRQRVAQAMRR